MKSREHRWLSNTGRQSHAGSSPCSTGVMGLLSSAPGWPHQPVTGAPGPCYARSLFLRPLLLLLSFPGREFRLLPSAAARGLEMRKSSLVNIKREAQRCPEAKSDGVGGIIFTSFKRILPWTLQKTQDKPLVDHVPLSTSLLWNGKSHLLPEDDLGFKENCRNKIFSEIILNV